jgi:hypothetical protein
VPYFGTMFLSLNYIDVTKTPVSEVEWLQRYWQEKNVVFIGST